MSLRLEPMSTAPASPTDPPRAELLRNMLLFGLLVFVVALGLPFLLRMARTGPTSWLVVLNGAALGLACGFSARWALDRHTPLLRLAAALAALAGGMAFQGWLTGWQVGIGPLEFWPGRVDWAGLGQFSLGMGAALLALYAWQAPALPHRPAVAPGPAAPSPPPRPRREKRPRGATRTRVPPPPEPAKRPARRKRRSRLQLSAREEHRCPYCLEPVQPGDPRGAVECRVCHTLHHADCWAITGACQVPHYNA